MPMERAMAQLSRPFQIALLAVGLLAAVWFFALRTHPASTGSSSATAPGSSAPSAAAQEQKAAAPTPVYHGAAPGVEGLTRAIAKAHAAVAASQQNAKQLEEKAARASSATPAGTSSTPSKGTSAAHPATTHKPASNGTSATRASRSKVGASTPARGHGRAVPPSMQVAVEGELKQGKVVMILFWNPKASVDAAVQRELQAVGHTLGAKIAVHDARADQVGSFGSITQAVQVFQTPTIVIVNKRGQARTLTGLTDVFSLEQAINEARHSQ
jgi:hypothetical protein